MLFHRQLSLCVDSLFVQYSSYCYIQVPDIRAIFSTENATELIILTGKNEEMKLAECAYVHNFHILGDKRNLCDNMISIETFSWYKKPILHEKDFF